MNKYSNLEELRRKKELLKKELADMEGLLTFENKKESLSAFTNGFTDRFLEERSTPEGESQLTLKTGEIAKSLKQALTEQSSKNSIINFNNTGLKENAMEAAMKVGGIALAGNLASKNLKKQSWKNKLFGLALIYLLPVAIKFISQKLEEYQKKKSISSMEQLI